MRQLPFGTNQIDEYQAKAKASWGKAEAYREYEERSRSRTRDEERAIGERMMVLFEEFGAIRETDPEGEAAQALVERLQGFITENFYTCTDEILLNLGKMYAAGGEMAANIDAHGGAGTAAFVARCIGARER